LLEAARWAANPAPQTDCSGDPDLDGQAECLLASGRFFAVLDPHGGRLAALFSGSPGGPRQLVAPTTQFITGLGDPSSWDPAAGEGAEPAGVHGAFADSPPPWPVYQPSQTADGITFTSPDAGLEKTFTLTETGLRVRYRTAGEAARVQIPLALDPWTRFSRGWGERYRIESGPGRALVRAGSLAVQVTTTGSLNVNAFSDSRAQLRLAEDPNFPYPAGHFLPFPLALVEIQSAGDFEVEIRVIG
jgi:hypothetical protein